MKYSKIIFTLILISISACRESEKLKNLDIKSQIKESVITDTITTHRTIKIYFCSNTLGGDAPLKVYSNILFKINNTEFSINRKDTITLNLPIQNHDTVFIKKENDKNYEIDRLLKFRHGVIYEWCVNSCSGIYYFSPTNTQPDTIQATVSFTIKNYTGKDRIIAQRGYNYGEDTIFLNNNIKTKYYNFLFMSAMCSSDAKRIAIENMDKEQIEIFQNNEEHRSNYTFLEFWYSDLHGQKLDIIYDFKSKKSTVLIAE